MKTKLRRLSKRCVSILLSVLMIISLVSVSIFTTFAWGVQGGNKVYYVNTGNWSTVYHHFWGNDWHNYEQMTQISNTGVYYKSYSNDYTANGFNFNNSKSDSGGSAACYNWVTQNTAYYGTGNSSFTDMSKLNGKAKVISMISTDGGTTYTKSANASCVATVSTKNITGGATATTDSSSSTGSSDTAESYPAYGATVTVSGSASGDYVFMGLSTTNSSSLPNDANTSNQSYVSLEYNGSTSNDVYYAYFKQSFTVTIQPKTGTTPNSSTGGTVSPASHTGLHNGHAAKTITATPKTQNDYVFAGWESVNGLVKFANSTSANTTYTATGTDTIYGKFTQETLYDVTVSLDGSTTDTYRAGATINPEITAADRSSEDYEFTSWTLTGNVQLASGYSTTDPTVKIKATGNGGTVTANFTHVDYIYFYAALQSNWNSNPVVTVDGSEISAYEWIANKDNNDDPVTLYNTKNTNDNSRIGDNGCYTYYIGVYRVPVAKVGTNISVFNSTQTGTNASNGYQGTVQSGHGYCYITYSGGESNNHVTKLNPQKPTSVTTPETRYDADNTININSVYNTYGSTMTAGQDSYTNTAQLKDSLGHLTTIAADQASSNTNFSFVPDSLLTGANAITTSGTYTVVVTSKDTTTGKIVNSFESASFTIDPTPTQATVSASAENGSVTGRAYTYKGSASASFANGASLRATSQVTLTYTLNNGYEKGTTTATGINASAITENYNASTRVLTLTFTVPSNVAAITVKHTASEIKHSIAIKRRFYNGDGTTNISTDSTAYTTITGAGISTAVGTGAAPTVADYTFKKWVLPSSGVTKSGGDLNTSAEITVNATADNKTIYIDYWETLYSIKGENQDSHGKIRRGSSTGTEVSTSSPTLIGNVTPVTLVAVPNQGYIFSSWLITGTGTNAATQCTINGHSYGLSSPASIDASTEPASSSFKFNGTATVKAYYIPVDYSIKAHLPFNHEYNQSNSVTVSPNHGQIGTQYTIQVTLADGYEVAGINGDGISSTMPNPTVSGNVYSYTYTLGAQHVDATVTLKAKTPTLSNVRITDTSFNFREFSNNATVPIYYLQPINVKANTETYASATIDYSDETNSNSGANNTEVQLNARSDIEPDTVDGTKDYTLTVRAKNHPSGVGVEYSSSQTFTIRVCFNDTQKIYFNMHKDTNLYMPEETGQNPYYDDDAGAELTNYETAYQDVYGSSGFARDNNYPAYTAVSGTQEYTDANTLKNTFESAFSALMEKAKTTTIYILTSYRNSSNYINFHCRSNGTSADWEHFQKNNNKSVLINTNRDEARASFCGTFKQTSASNRPKYYLYKFEYTGHIGFLAWQTTNPAQTTTGDSFNKLTKDITNCTDFKKYYIDSVTRQDSTTASVYKPFDNTYNSGKIILAKDFPLSKSELTAQDKLGIGPSSSLVDAPGIYTENTMFRLIGVSGKAKNHTYDMINNTVDGEELENNKFPAYYPGKYRVEYTTKFGTDENNANIIASLENKYFWVANDEVDVYVDMNENVGVPVLKFKYKVDAQGNPASSGTDAILPCEMDLVTGSDSIYKYTVKKATLDSYNIAITDNIIKIDSIDVENTSYTNNNAGFTLAADALTNGEAWLKADSTNLKTFNIISYGSQTKGFVAAKSDGTAISGGINNLKGTGIVVDDEFQTGEDLYHVSYAAEYTPEEAQSLIYKFGYNVKAGANEEVKVGDNTYYFDKWVKISKSPDEFKGSTTLSLEGAVDYSTKANLNFNSAPVYSNDSGDETYVALYKLANSSDNTVRVKVTYKFNDYDTSDGNYVYDANKDKKAATYTKTIKVKVGSGQTYADFAAVNTQAAVNSIVSSSANCPLIKSNYFDYEYTANSAVIKSSDASGSKIVAEASFTESPHVYRIIVKNGSSIINGKNGQGDTGNYQQTVELSAPSGMSNPVWKDNKTGKVIGTGATFTARYVSSGNDSNSGTDCQIINVESDSSVSTNNTSEITNSYTEVYYEGTTKKLKHNFYIVDYCAQGNLLGGGVLYATTDGTNYRQSNAATVLATSKTRRNFISGILNNDYDTEYKAQTINNVGFRYKPYKAKEDVYRYSDVLNAYQYIYSGSNANNVDYNGQTLRVFSFMVYNNSGTPVIVPSEGYAEVSRYIP